MTRERSVSDVCEVLALGLSFRGRVIKHCLCISREICTVPSLYRGLIQRYMDGCSFLLHSFFLFTHFGSEKTVLDIGIKCEGLYMYCYVA